MAIVADTYRRAALERAHEAYELHEREAYGLAHYVAGLAVECMLRAYRVRDDPQFDARHDLKQLCKAASFYQFIPEDDETQVKMSAAVNEVARRWRNNHRYRDDLELRHWLKDAGLDQGVKGDLLKASSRQIVNAALEVVAVGGRRWNSRRD